jgi:hypothetical protein
MNYLMSCSWNQLKYEDSGPRLGKVAEIEAQILMERTENSDTSKLSVEYETRIFIICY